MFKFIGSQTEWESDINLTYPPVKLNGLQTTGPRSLVTHLTAILPGAVLIRIA